MDPGFLSTGHRGWKPDGCPNFYAGRAHHVAHDVIDHARDTEDFEGELMAFGATLFGRVTGVHSSSDRNGQIEGTAHDLAAFLSKEKYQFKAPKPYARRLRLDDAAEKYLKLILNESISFTARDAGRCTDPTCGCGSKSMSEVLFRFVQEDVASWIRLGYRLAKRTYKDPFAMNKMFHNLADDVGVDHDARRPYNGDKLTVTVDTVKHTYSLHRH